MAPHHVELPVVYRTVRAWTAAFPCATEGLRTLLPDSRLRPIEVFPGTTALGVAVFDYLDTTIGPYREVGLAIPCRYLGSTTIPMFPLLAERWLEDVGHWVVSLPVTTEIANQAGRTFWGYPKYVGEIDIDATDREVRCSVSKGGAKVLSVEIQRPGRSRPMTFPMRTYSRLDDEILLTELRVDALGHLRRLGGRARLVLHDHPQNEPLQSIGLRGDRTIEVRWFDEYRTVLDRARARFRIGG